MENTSINYSNVTNSTVCSDDYCVEDTLYRKILGSIIFIIVWPFIVLDMKWFPISRPAAALVGATFMVIFVVVPEEQVFHIVGDKGNLQTIFLLIGMMLLSYYYDREGLLRIVALWIFSRNKPFKHVLWKICILSAILSAIITNDATCLVITPLLVNEHVKQRRPQSELLPMLLGIATSANIGSASTFFGNPQNAFIAANSRGQISLLIFFVTSLPAAILGILLSILLLYLIFFRTVFPKRICNHVENNDNHENLADSNPNVYSVEVTEQMLAPTLSESREEMALSYDGSTNPHLSSQIAYERRIMYRTASGQDSDTGVLKSRSRYSLPEDFRRVPFSSPPVDRTASVSNPMVSTSHYGAIQDSSARTSQKGFANLPNPYPHHHIRNREQHHSNRNSLQRGTPLPEIPERETSQHELQLTNEDEREVVETVSFKKRKWQEILFVIWLIAITVVVVALLAVPPLKHVQFNLGLIPLGAGILTMLVDTILNRKYPYDAITKIDWAVILMFMGLFIWLGGFQNTNIPNLIFDTILPYMDLFKVEGVLLFSVAVVIGSNVLSNVPLVILIVDQLFVFHCGGEISHCTGQLTGVLLAWVSTIAGNFTLIGSVANLIVAEKARSCADYRLTFWGYLKFGFVSTLVVLFAGLPIVYFTGRYVKIPTI